MKLERLALSSSETFRQVALDVALKFNGVLVHSSDPSEVSNTASGPEDGDTSSRAAGAGEEVGRVTGSSRRGDRRKVHHHVSETPSVRTLHVKRDRLQFLSQAGSLPRNVTETRRVTHGLDSPFFQAIQWPLLRVSDRLDRLLIDGLVARKESTWRRVGPSSQGPESDCSAHLRGTDRVAVREISRSTTETFRRPPLLGKR